MPVGKDKSWLAIRIITIIILVGLSLSIILPFLNILALSFNNGNDAQKGGIYFWPRMFTFDNYIEIFKQGKIVNALWISVFKTVVGTVLSVLLTAMAAFALSSKTLPFRKTITFFIFFTMLFSGGIIPLYLVLNQLHLTNTIWVYIIPSLYSVWNILIMRTFFLEIPDSVKEAAMLDGCNDFQIFWRIILPMSRPVIATIALFNIVSQWNDWFTGSFFVRDANLKPIATVLQEMLTTQEAIADALKQKSGSYEMLDKITITGESLQMATIVIVIIPVLLIYPFIQKHFVKGVNIGSMKE